MTLGIDTDMASVTTHFKHLDMPTWGMRITEIFIDCFFRDGVLKIK